MTDRTEQLARRVRDALGEFNDDDLPVVEAVRRLVGRATVHLRIEDAMQGRVQQSPAEAQPVAWATCNRDCDCVGECKAGVERPVTPPSAPVGVTHAERGVIETLLDLAYAAWSLADSSEDAGGEGLTVERTDFAVLEKHLDTLSDLPDDRPGHTLGEAAKARWALRRLLSNTTPPSAPVGVEAIAAEDDAAWALASRAEAAGAERDESDDDLWWTLRIEQFKALAQQPAAVDEAGWCPTCGIWRPIGSGERQKGEWS